MLIEPADISGLFIIKPQRHEDNRGYFARTFDRDAFAACNLHTDFPQCSTSFSRELGTLRGMHWQAPPHEEIKLVRATRGAAYDVVVDLRPDSPTHMQWFARTLSADNGEAIYIPAGCAHGFQTLEPETEIHYHISTPHAPHAARGARYNDPAFNIDWPIIDAPRILSQRDQNWPDYHAP